MKFLVICVLFCITAVVANPFIPKPIGPHKESGSRIISGQPAQPGQFPHQVLTESRVPAGISFCGGALLCDRWAITAAHCALDADLFLLYLGAVNQSQAVEAGRIEVLTKTAFIHDQYNPFTNHYDVALVKFDDGPINFTDRIQPIPLGKERLGDNVSVTVSGWGKTKDDGEESPILNYVNLRTISNEECIRIYGSLIIINSTVCAKGLAEENACEGDSGGALISKNAEGKFEHVGVVSFVNINCESGKPSGYIRTESIHSWILETINGTCTLP